MPTPNQEPSSIILKAENIVKQYGELTVLREVSLELRQGELVTITGASGAGKSTLLHILGGLDQPDSGKILLDGENLTRLSTQKQMQVRNQKIGFVFQFHHLLPEFTALENTAMPLLIKGLNNKEAEQQAAVMLERVGLASRQSHKPGALSGGEQQRVAIARALINHPTIVLADEPTGNLDSQTAKTIHELFLELQKSLQLTFVIVTHNKELAEIGDRKLKMQDGHFVN